MSDSKTINEIKDRLNKIIKQIAHSESLGLSDITQELCDEKEKLTIYLKEVLKESGGIKYFTEQSRLSKKAVKNAIKRFVAEIRTNHPDIADYVLKGLHTDSFGASFKI